MNADAERGAKIFRTKCSHCHSVTKDAKEHKYGPNLFNIVNREAGTNPAYTKYSSANKASSVIFDQSTLYHYLQAPKKIIPNTKKPFQGISSAQDRLDLIAYLQQHHE